jgi:hypothetical protein
MVSLSTPWTTQDHADRQLLVSIPVIAALVPKLDDAHKSLLSTQPATTAPERVTVIQEEQKQIDTRHDDVIRGCYLLPQALAYLTGDEALAERLLSLQEVLLPEGLIATQKSYREEAGQAALLHSRLLPEHVALLKKIKTTEGSLWDSVKEWEHLAEKLGALEDERAGLAEDTSLVPADAVSARNKWIRTVNAMRTVLDLVGADRPGIVAILKRIADVERKADRRVAGAEKTGEDDALAPIEFADGD